MSDSDALPGIRAACRHVAETLPIADIDSATKNVDTALAALAAAGTTRHPQFLAATRGLRSIRASLDVVRYDLEMAARHARSLGERMQ